MGEIGADRPVDDQPAQRGAALARRADGGEDDRPDRHVEIGGGGDDHRVVAAELEHRAAEPRGDLRPDDRAHAGRAGGRDDRHPLRGDERFADRRTADDDLRQAFGRVGTEALERALEDLHRRQRRERRLLRRLPDHRSPQTSASAAFHAQTATGKLKAEMIAHGPMRMPGLGHPVAGPLGSDHEAVQLARQADGEIADVDHLLHFAQALGDDLAGLERHQRAERLLRGAQFLAKQAHELAPPGRRNLAPGQEGLVGGLDDRRHVGGRRLFQARDLGAVDRRADGERAARKRRGRQTQALENVLAGHGWLILCLSLAYRAARGGKASLRPQFRRSGKSPLRGSARALG